MDGFGLREPVSAITHGFGFLVAVAAGLALAARARRARRHEVGVLVFGLSLVACYGFSAIYHAHLGDHDEIACLRRLDHVGIFGLIAGTYTPIVAALLIGPWRLMTLGTAWVAALGGSGFIATQGVLPSIVSTSMYLALGWGAIFAYREILRRHPGRTLRLVLVGGVCYSIGAVFNLVGWPNPMPGLVGPHEVFHLFVMAGSAAHFTFIWRLVHESPTPELDPTRRIDGAHSGNAAAPIWLRLGARIVTRDRTRPRD